MLLVTTNPSKALPVSDCHVTVILPSPVAACTPCGGLGGSVPSRFTVTLCEALPPLPVHVRVKVVVAVSAAEVPVPEADFAPVHPPRAVQLDAFVLLQVKPAVDPDAI